jgi:type II secretory pathway predicted ATPase ExeA
MFLDFYKLRQQPFGVTPDPRYLYFSPGHREALASLFYGLEAGRGFLALIAEPGMGKTTLLFQLLERLRNSVRSVFLFQTQCDSHELLRYVTGALGIESQDHDLVDMHAQLNEVLLREAQAGRPVLLVIDEAQNLSDSVLETVRLLSDFEASDRKLLHIVLAGQPELAHRLSQPRLAQLRQRISILTRLEPLSAAETGRYINHRLQVAGYDGPELFTSPALALIAERSQGIPRNINNICFNALSLGCATGRKKIGPDEVQEATADLSLDPLVRQPQATPPVTSTFRPVSRSLFSRVKESLLAARPLQTAAIFALLAGLMIYFGERSKAGPAAPTGAIHQVTPDTEGVSGSETVSAPLTRDESSDLSRYTPVQTNSEKDSPLSFTYVVQPHETLRSLCMRFLGRYNDSVLTEIWKLNENLTDPDHIDVGQQLRFPVSPQVEGNGRPNGEQFRKRGR